MFSFKGFGKSQIMDDTLDGDKIVAAAFIGAIAVLLFVAGYVISRLAGERAYKEKWKDYNDCGWA